MTLKSPRQSLVRHGSALLALVLLIAALSSAGVAGGDELWQKQQAGSFEVSLSVRQPTEVKQNTGRKSSAAAEPHLFVVSILRPPGGNPIFDAEVTANVAEAGFAGLEKPMPLTAVGNEHLYTNYFAISPGKTYRVIVHIGGPKFARILEAQFQYRHHH